MAKSISHPDCVHCYFMVHHKNGESRCHHHNITLYSPVSLFCNMITYNGHKDADYQQWFKSKLDTNLYQGNLLYTWIETPIQDSQGQHQTRIDAEVVAPVTSYSKWSAGIFWQYLRDLRLTKRKHYSKQGYFVDIGAE